MDVILNQGYPDYIGRRFAWCGYAVGPKSYTSGGETLNLATAGYIDSVDGGIISVSGNYWARPVPSTVGPRATWKLQIYAVGSFTQTSGDLSAEKFVLSGLGGRY